MISISTPKTPFQATANSWAILAKKQNKVNTELHFLHKGFHIALQEQARRMCIIVSFQLVMNSREMCHLNSYKPSVKYPKGHQSTQIRHPSEWRQGLFLMDVCSLCHTLKWKQ